MKNQKKKTNLNRKERGILSQDNPSVCSKSRTAGIYCQHKPSVSSKTEAAGLTLVALVATIVVLLILAGITIMYVMGDNSIFKLASQAKLETELGKIEEQAGLIYSSLVTEKYATNSNKEITTSDIVNKLEGYEIKEIPLAENAITGIEIEKLTNNKITLTPNETKELTINVITSEGGYAYYAVIEGKNYEIKLENGKLTVSREPQDVGGGTTASLELEVLEGSTVTASKKENEEKVVVLQAGALAGSTKIKVTYGGKPLEFIAEVEIKPSVNAEEDIEGVTFKTDFGKIDIIWLEGTTNNPSNPQTPNSPANYLNGMQPVKWDGTTEDDTITATDSDWYSYNAATGTTDNTASYWANAKTTGTTKSYFVWIPRYAYRITYYDVDPNANPDTAQITGYYDGYGMWRASDGALKCKLETQKDASGNEVKDKDGNSISLVETINYNGEKYIVHPAFTTNLDMGGWSTNLPGFWFAKFEMSGSSASTLASVPGVESYRSATIGTFYDVARSATYGMTGTVDNTVNGGDGNTSFMNSHMAKNSEWGAVAYLTHSKYGRNGYEIGFSNAGYYTGGALGATAYTGTSSQLQSTTGNPYGVYDMRGGAYEYTASWDTLATDPYSHLGNGSTFASKGGSSTKYATAYNGTSNHTGEDVYAVCKTGDGIKEIYVSGSTGWHSDCSSFADSGVPFFERGSNYKNTEAYAGVFCSYSNFGGGSSDGGFRAVLCP